MPWSCPNCGLKVGHGNITNHLPTVGEVYRCPVCRMQLTFDAKLMKMVPVESSRKPDQPTPR
jgi:hypothetical protein